MKPRPTCNLYTLAATAFGRNMAGLRTIKAKYDRDNFFRLNANIAPAS
jgi:hypothetical protein